MKEFDTAQVEQLKTIGDYLQRERQEQAISLDEIAVKTYIPLRLLQALELGNVERLPEPVFVQGFIRRYADAIGLDGTALAKNFTPQPSFVVERKAPEPERLDSIEKPRVESLPEPHEGRDRAERSNLPFVLLGTGAVLLLGVGLAAVLSRPQAETRLQNSQPVAVEPKSVSAVPQPDVKVSSAPALSSQGSANPSPTPITSASQTLAAPNLAADGTTKPVQVAVKLIGEESWLQVIADGKVEFEGILKKGEQKNWQAKKTLVLQSGNAGAVLVSYNQGEPKVMGALGDVKDAEFPPKVPAKPASTN
ncbi:helix-turn-helix domain-containing protein [Leptolyngbya sp. FACHB-321]|uniref:helix-turn-helix domain-containing protein n=1 Tax=Leptolyngbya sp. FACHB-321 TaxID=2692807 RepID=UPI0016838F8E|nr:RodZ domain-containing protein [Leptolyngbya sp. FACHB-321]MBD2036413.1 helix-turn-helix domain-containing protein [Leptolyngbya sp. FACHB-321]